MIIRLLIFIVVSVCCVALHGRDNPSPLASGNIDSLRQIAGSTDVADTIRVRALLDLSWALKSSEPEQALEYGKAALELAEQNQIQPLVADVLLHIGVVYWQLGNFRFAFNFLRESYLISHEENYQSGVAKSMANLGLVLMEQGHYEEALENYFEALRTFEDMGRNDLTAPVLNNIGLVYQHQGQHDMAESYFRQSLSIKKELNDERGIAFSLNDIGVSMQAKGNFQEALNYFNEALAIRERLHDKREVAITALNLGSLYSEMGDYNFAIVKLLRARNLFEEVNDESGRARVLHRIGLVRRQLGQLDLSMQNLRSSLRIAREIGQMSLVVDNYRELAILYSEMGLYRQAFNIGRQYIQLNDSLFAHETQQRLIELRILYDHEQKENEIELLRKNNQIIELSLNQQMILRNILVGSVFFVLILLFVLYNRFLLFSRKNRLLEVQKEEISISNQKLVSLNNDLQKQNEKIAELNEKLNQTNKQLIKSEQHLREINATKDKFFSIISHDLRNPFASIVSFSRILQRDLRQLDENELLELTKELDKSIFKINNLLDNLLHWSRSQTGKIKFEPEYLVLNDLIQDNINLFISKSREKEIVISNQVFPNLVVFADGNMVNAIIRNLLSNALKFSESGSTIEISSQIVRKMAFVKVKDEGVGMTPSQIKHIWDSEKVNTSYGTRDEKGSGLGLMLCKEFVERNGGEISVKSEKGHGSEFTFSLPLNENL
ncbi:MAG TPA: tetratricopeptide repeat-containing sensor histidine kinase [Bacteroidales bacterium]|nr:tetratricopeptide repeat-containing sensor histidine kinase [Bacteroidales bacterium]